MAVFAPGTGVSVVDGAPGDDTIELDWSGITTNVRMEAPVGGAGLITWVPGTNGMVPGADWTRLLEHSEPDPRDSAVTFEFGGYYWLSSGFQSGQPDLRDLWRTQDFVNWEFVTNNTAYEPYSRILHYNGQLFAIGRDVWTSIDGVNWTELVSQAQGLFDGHFSYRSTVFAGKMWTFVAEKVWSSTNGITWTHESDIGIGDRSTYQLVVFNGKMFVIGGFDPVPNDPPEIYQFGLTTRKDIWSSADGITWTRVLDDPDTPFSPRLWSAAIVHQGNLYLLGGFDNITPGLSEGARNLNEVWISPDGENWTQLDPTSFEEFGRRHAPAVYSDGDDIVVVGGHQFPVSDDVWRYTDDGRFSRVTFTGIEQFDLTLGSGDDDISTADGNDTIRGGPGNDAIDAGDGDDVAVFSGSRAGYIVTVLPNGDIVVADQRSGSPDGTDTVRGVENFEFADGVLTAVTVLDDHPVGTNNTVAVPEDNGYAFSLADFGFADPNDDPASPFTAVIIAALPLAGALRLGGVPVTAGQEVDVADIVDGKLVFTPAANSNGNGYASFTFQVIDDGFLSSNIDPTPKAMTINVTPVNDAPVVAKPIDDVTVFSGSANSFQFSADVFFDVDGDALTYIATLANGNPLPTWLDFDPLTRTFSAAMPANSRMPVEVRVTASDLGLFISDTFSFRPLQIPNSDFNGDKKADILLRNDVDGRVGIWEMNGHGVQWGGTIGTVDASWHIVDVADFSGDGKSDILLRNASDGRVGMWEINSRALSWAATIATVDLSWHIAETGDFNGDGKADILWRNDDGRVGIWEMDGRNPVWGGTIATVGNNWQIADTGDFNGDGKSDILLRDMTDGRVGIWEMDGRNPVWGGTIATVGNNWQIADTGDFNGDGKSDILLRDMTDGRVGIWEMNGHALSWGGTIATVDGSWQISETCDFNGDGKSDILWRNDADKRVGIWEMDGHALTWAGTIATMDSFWQIIV